MGLLEEFRPALLFLGKFLLLYFVANIVYGIYIESFDEKPDGLTHLVSAQSAAVLKCFGYNTTWEDAAGVPKVALKDGGHVVLNVYEGCNGINVMIVFAAFIFAFGGPVRPVWIFLIAGLVIIHLFNLARVGLLFYLAVGDSPQFYYYHKYFFTAVLYAVVFGLWAIWVIRFNERPNVKRPGT